MEILEERVGSSRGRCNPRAVKRKMSKYKTKHRQKKPDTDFIDYEKRIGIVK